VPILVAAWGCSNKEIVLGRIWQTANDIAQDAADIQAYINRRYVGRHIEKQ